MKLLQRMVRVEERGVLPNEHQRMVAEDAVKFASKLQNYADGLSVTMGNMPAAERSGTMSPAVQLAWHMRFAPVQA